MRPQPVILGPPDPHPQDRRGQPVSQARAKQPAQRSERGDRHAKQLFRQDLDRPAYRQRHRDARATEVE